MKVVRVESLRPGLVEKSGTAHVGQWLEHVETTLEPEWTTDEGRGFCYRVGMMRYLAACPDSSLLNAILAQVASDAGLQRFPLPEGVRLRRNGDLTFAFNYESETVTLAVPAEAELLVGTAELEPAGVAVWRSA